MLVGVGHRLLARETDEGWSSVRCRGELVGREWTRNGLLCGASGAGGSWLIRGGWSFLLFFSSSLCWRGWGARRPDALLAPDVQALAVALTLYIG